MDFEKKPSLFELAFSIQGVIHTYCDTCNDPLDVNIEGDQSLIVKFGDEPVEMTEDLIIIPRSADELDITEIVYEYVAVLLPAKVAHANEADCDPDIIERLKAQAAPTEKENIDPRWDQLNKLKN